MTTPGRKPERAQESRDLPEPDRSSELRRAVLKTTHDLQNSLMALRCLCDGSSGDLPDANASMIELIDGAIDQVRRLATQGRQTHRSGSCPTLHST